MPSELAPSASSAVFQASVSASSNPYCDFRDGGKEVTSSKTLGWKAQTLSLEAGHPSLRLLQGEPVLKKVSCQVKHRIEVTIKPLSPSPTL